MKELKKDKRALSLAKKIEILRTQLNDLSSRTKNTGFDHRHLDLSQQLDKLIAEYMVIESKQKNDE